MTRTLLPGRDAAGRGAELDVCREGLQAGRQNKSGIDCDMLCETSESKIVVDGDVFHKDKDFRV
jgi:hypothetical protein